MVAVEVSLPDPQLPDQAATGERIVHEPVPCDGFRIKVGILQCTIGGTRAMAGHRITIKLMNFQCKRDISAMQPLDPSSLAGTPRYCNAAWRRCSLPYRLARRTPISGWKSLLACRVGTFLPMAQRKP